MKTFHFLIMLFAVYAFQCMTTGRADATPEYARQSGLECGACHVELIGGGKLTPTGEGFLADLRKKGQVRSLTGLQHMVRLVIGYLHMLAAIIWFGTIMYVHVLLKPAYASKGLPRGELRLGWISMLTLLATGVFLTIARMPNLAAFVTTRFGVLLGIKILLFLIMLSSALITTIYIGPRLRRKFKVQAGAAGDLSPEQLAGFNGKEGRPAYIAYKGSIYDVSASRLWKNGSHMVKHLAGNDLTEALALAPHAEDKVLSMPRTGMLTISEKKPERPFHEKLFYFFAYMNLALVFVIVFVISLWRWW